jgi:hypothetical protein
MRPHPSTDVQIAPSASLSEHQHTTSSASCQRIQSSTNDSLPPRTNQPRRTQSCTISITTTSCRLAHLRRTLRHRKFASSHHAPQSPAPYPPSAVGHRPEESSRKQAAPCFLHRCRSSRIYQHFWLQGSCCRNSFVRSSQTDQS